MSPYRQAPPPEPLLTSEELLNQAFDRFHETCERACRAFEKMAEERRMMLQKEPE